jgi:hypothetical protein
METVFPRWLSTIAFESKGLIMKHAMDVAIMLDALAYDPRLDLKYLIPVNPNIYFKSNSTKPNHST